MDKKDLIKQYLLDKNISDKERKRRFEIAWDVWENFGEIKEKLKKNFFEKIVFSLKRKFCSQFVLIEENFIELKQWGKLYLFKNNWRYKEENRGFFQYQIEFWGKSGRCMGFGIAKYDDKIPYQGSLKKLIAELPEVEKIANKLQNYGHVVFDDEWWIVKREFKEPYYNKDDQLKFYLKLLNMENAVDEIVDEIDKLIKATDSIIDELVYFLSNINK